MAQAFASDPPLPIVLSSRARHPRFASPEDNSSGGGLRMHAQIMSDVGQGKFDAARNQSFFENDWPTSRARFNARVGSHRFLRCSLQQFLQLLPVELRIAGREMAACFAGGGDQEQAAVFAALQRGMRDGGFRWIAVVVGGID